MIDEFPPIGSGQTLVNLCGKPLVIIDHAFDSLDYKRSAVASLLRSQARKFFLRFG